MKRLMITVLASAALAGGASALAQTATTPYPPKKTIGIAQASSAPAPSNTQNAAPAFRSGNLVRLRSGGPLMTVKGMKGDQVDCFWSDGNGEINADSFPVDVLRPG